MKLLSCYIENYGKIKAKSYDFSEGITVFCEANGEGKTTLASFIKAIFYGLEGYRKDSKKFCDREHFYPFDGGRFGGNLTFETGGDRYKIERFFGDKSETADTLKVYKNGEEFTGFGEEIGRELFGVDKDSFERTTFLESGDLEIKSTTGIHARLNRFLEGVEDDGSLDKAQLALEKAAKRYKKSKAGSDKISEETARLAKLNAEIDNTAAVKIALEGKYARAKAMQGEIDGLHTQIVEAQKRNERLSQFEHYDSLLLDVEKAQTDLKDITVRYPLGVPTLEETEALNEYLVRGKELQARADGVEFSQKDKEKLALLQGVFKEGAPTEAELLSVEQEMDELSKAGAEKRLREGEGESENELRLQAKFAHGQPTAAQMETARAEVERYKETKRRYDETPSRPTSGLGNFNKRSMLCFLAAVIFGVLGAGLSFWNLRWAAPFLCITVALLILGTALRGRATSEASENRRLENALREAEDSAKSVLLPYGYHSGNGLVFDFATMEADVAAFTALAVRRAEKAQALAALQEKIEKTEEDLTAFFRRFGLSSDSYVKRLADLRVFRSDYLDLSSRQATAAKGKREIEEALIENRARVEGYRAKYGLAELAVGRILGDIKEYARLARLIKEQAEKAAAYQTEKGLSQREELPVADLEELQTALKSLQSDKSLLDREIAEDERIAEQLEGYEEEKAEAERSLKEYKRKHKLLTAANELLKEADARLRDRYVKPIMDEFLYYAGIIEGALGEKVVMTKDFELRFERNGAERSERHFSSGQRTVCALCFRLALIKNMYREQLPFLILDDPFTALDSEHIEKVRSVLRTLSKDMQMIYFTCHESRKI